MCICMYTYEYKYLYKHTYIKRKVHDTFKCTYMYVHIRGCAHIQEPVHVAAVMPAAAAEVVRHKLEGAGWAETEAPDVEQAWVLQVILEHTRAQVWQHAQTRILEMLSVCTLSKSRLEEFARIAAASDMFIHFGETLTGRTASLRQVKTNL